MENLPYRKSSLAIVVVTIMSITVAAKAEKSLLSLSDWNPVGSVGVKETYDDNVLLQDGTDQRYRSSMITTISPSIGVTWADKGQWDTNLTLNYAPQIVVFHSEPDESHIDHVGKVNLSWKKPGWAIDVENTITQIQGTDQAPTFTGQGGAPAIGGIPIRDRRDATIFRGDYKLAFTDGPWMIRPVVSAYVHDFHTVHDAAAGHMNYTDRNEFAGGVDVGYKVLGDMYATVGYRYGRQHQALTLDSPLGYSNAFQRVLFGAEGKPTDWLKLAVAIGPDFRVFGHDTADGFDDTQTLIYVDGKATITISPDDEVGLFVKRFTLPAFGGRSVYEDITCRVNYKRKLTKDLSAELMLQAYAGEWLKPVYRDDWIYTIGLSATYKFTDKLSGEVGWSLDRAESNLPDTPSREFHRNMAWLGLKLAL